MASVQNLDERLTRVETLTANLERFLDLDTRQKRTETLLSGLAQKLREFTDERGPQFDRALMALQQDLQNLIVQQGKDREYMDAVLLTIAHRLDFTMRHITLTKEVQGLLDLAPRKVTATLADLYDQANPAAPPDASPSQGPTPPETGAPAPGAEPPGPRLVIPAGA